VLDVELSLMSMTFAYKGNVTSRIQVILSCIRNEYYAWWAAGGHFVLNEEHVNLLEPKRYHVYYQVFHSEILYSAHNVFTLFLFYGSQNKQRSFFDTVATYRFL